MSADWLRVALVIGKHVQHLVATIIAATLGCSFVSPEAIWVTIIGVSAATLVPRILPVALFSGFEFPKLLIKWLSYVAPAVLGALTALSILAPEGSCI